MHRNVSKISPKNNDKICIPPKNINFSENPQNSEIQNFEPQKMTQADVCMKISEYHPPPPGDIPPKLKILITVIS